MKRNSLLGLEKKLCYQWQARWQEEPIAQSGRITGCVHEIRFDPTTMGEEFRMELSAGWIVVGEEIAAGTPIVPIIIPVTDETNQLAALHLAKQDLSFALFCFNEANKHGLPSESNPISKALINAGTISYARIFSNNVRIFKLTTDYFSEIWGTTGLGLHNYLYNLRDKHIAHSVNDFERADAVGVVTIDNNSQLLSTNPCGVGVVLTASIGMPFVKLQECPIHLEKMIELIDQKILGLRTEICKQFHPTLKVGQRVEIHPMGKVPNRGKIAKRRS